MANLAIVINSKSEFETVKKHNIECGYEPDECYDTLYYPEYKYFTFGDAWVTAGLKFIEDNNFEVISFQSFLTLTGVELETGEIEVPISEQMKARVLIDRVIITTNGNNHTVLSKGTITEISIAFNKLENGN